MKFILIVCLDLMAICFRSVTDKETPDWTGTTQGENVSDTLEVQRKNVSDTLEVQRKQDSINLHLQKCVRISKKAQKEIDSINNNIK